MPRPWLLIRCIFLCLAATSLREKTYGENPPGTRVVEPVLTAKDRAHWAFQRPTRPVLPDVRQNQWVSTPIDQFILARLEKAGLHPAAATDRANLLRRVSLDL